MKEAQKLIDKETSESNKKRKTQHIKYVKNQWKGVENSLKYKKKHQLRCSTEGYVSHILSSRLLCWNRRRIRSCDKINNINIKWSN